MWEITGDSTGRAWRLHPTADKLNAPGSGERFRATAADDGSFALIHRHFKEPPWLEDVDRLRSAITIARLPEIKSESSIRALLDAAETETTHGDFGVPGQLVAIWEWADISLADYLADPDEPSDRVVANVGDNVHKALQAVHRAGFAHLDVSPDNILRVAGEWKLADFNSSERLGAPAIYQPGDNRFVHPDRDHNARAREEFDFFGLEAILCVIREM